MLLHLFLLDKHHIRKLQIHSLLRLRIFDTYFENTLSLSLQLKSARLIKTVRFASSIHLPLLPPARRETSSTRRVKLSTGTLVNLPSPKMCSSAFSYSNEVCSGTSSTHSLLPFSTSCFILFSTSVVLPLLARPNINFITANTILYSFM
mgnify:CR=1 FL=1